MRTTVPRGWLSVCFLALAACGAVGSNQVMSRYRYAEWAVVDRELLDSMVLALPLATLLATVISLRYLDDGLPWNHGHLPRARASKLAAVASCAAASSLGLLAGWTPVAVWSLNNAGEGHPSLLNLLATAMWIWAAVFFAAGLTSAFKSFWPGVALAGSWIAAFGLGRAASASGSSATLTTRLAAYGLDGVYGATYGPLHQSPTLLALRIAGGTLVCAAGAYAIHRASGVVGRAPRIRAAFATLPALAALACIGGTALVETPIAHESREALVCKDASGVKVCVYPGHAPDLARLTGLVARLHSRAPGLFLASRVSEQAAPPDSRVSLGAEKDSYTDRDILSQLASTAYDPKGCYGAPGRTDFTIPTLVSEWLIYQGTGSSPLGQLTGTTKAHFETWLRDPAATNAALAKVWPRVQNCTASVSDLPQ